MADIEQEAGAPAIEDLDLSAPGVVDKYGVAAEIANQALQHVIAAAVPGKKIVELCAMGDQFITEETKKRGYKSGKIEKGVGFPTCVSVNHCCGHYSPLEEDATVLAEGDVTKIDLGVHIDGFLALVAHTIVVGVSEVTGRKADAIAAAYNAAEIACRVIKPGVTNNEVTKFIERAIAAYECQAVEGVASQELRRFTIEGPKCFLNKQLAEKKIPDSTFEVNEVYAVDIVVSTGEGKARELDSRVTVLKRSTEASYALKLKASRQLYHEVKTAHPHFPFSLREFGSQKAKMGLVECVRHNLLQTFPVLFERDGEMVVQFKFTVLLLPSGVKKITGLPCPAVKSDKSITDDELKAILASSLSKKSKKKKAKAEGAAASS